MGPRCNTPIQIFKYSFSFSCHTFHVSCNNFQLWRVTKWKLRNEMKTGNVSEVNWSEANLIFPFLRERSGTQVQYISEARALGGTCRKKEGVFCVLFLKWSSSSFLLFTVHDTTHTTRHTIIVSRARQGSSRASAEQDILYGTVSSEG